jgi:hypothetical protein
MRLRCYGSEGARVLLRQDAVHLQRRAGMGERERHLQEAGVKRVQTHTMTICNEANINRKIIPISLRLVPGSLALRCAAFQK